MIYALEFITISNYGMQIGCFNISQEKKYLVFESKAYYYSLDPQCLGNLVKEHLMKSIASYKTYAFGLVSIIDCYQKGVPVEPRQFVIQSERRGKIPNANPAQEREQKRENDKDSKREEGSDSESDSSGQAEDNSSVLDSDSSSSRRDNDTLEKERELLEFIRTNEILRNSFDFQNLSRNEKGYVYEGYQSSTLKKFLEIAEFDRGLLDKIKHTLKEMYEQNLEFISFPSNYISVQEIEPGKIKFQFIPKDISKIANKRSENSPSAKEYDIKMSKELNSLLCQVISDRCHVKYQINTQDMIPPQNFKNKELLADENIIGHGGFGDVYKNELHGQEVAIKFPREVKESESKAKRRIAKELQMMKCLPHENIVKVYGVVEYDKKLGLVLEYCKNGGLNTYVKKSPTISMKERIEMLFGASLGLEFMHSKQICHFDIKPHNMFLNEENTVKLADFGMSEHLEEGKSFKPGFTLLYCSPEQIKGENPGMKADVWSFGMSMYFVSHGRAPFDYLEKMKGHKLEKKEFYQELKKKLRKPRVQEDVERNFPRFVSLMRETWSEAPDRRPTMRDVKIGLKNALATILNRIGDKEEDLLR